MKNALSSCAPLEHSLSTDTFPAIADYGVIGNCHTAALVILSVCGPRLNYAQTMPGFCGSGCQVKFGEFQVTAPIAWQVDESGQALVCRMTVQAGTRVAFTLEMQASPTPHADPEDALTSAIHFWQNWANQCTYQGPYRNAVVRSALVLKLMTYLCIYTTQTTPERLFIY